MSTHITHMSTHMSTHITHVHSHVKSETTTVLPHKQVYGCLLVYL